MRRDFLLLLFATIVLAADVFVYPPPSNSIPDDSNQLPRFSVGTTITLRWSSNLKTISIGLRTKGDKIILLGGAAQGNVLEQQPNRNTTSWKVQSIGTTESDGTYYLAGISADKSSFFTSNYFIIEPADTTTTSSTSSTSSSSTSSSATGSGQLPTLQTPNPATAETSKSPLPAQSVVPKTGLSTGTKVALGVAVPLGIIAILAGAFFLYRRGVRKGRMAGTEKGEAGLPHQPPTYHSYQTPTQHGGFYEPRKAYISPVEMGESQGGYRHELPTEHQQRHQLN